jgi:hypothetical protein
MGSGRSNQLAGQIAEHLVCAELGKRDLIATAFSGNVPAFDVIAADEHCNTAPIQVKSSRSDTWPSNAKYWMDIEFDQETNKQEYKGPVVLTTPELIYVHVALKKPNDANNDRFFILNMSDLQQIAIENYTRWMDERGWKRPRKPESLDYRYKIKDLVEFEDNWNLIEERFRGDGS